VAGMEQRHTGQKESRRCQLTARGKRRNGWAALGCAVAIPAAELVLSPMLPTRAERLSEQHRASLRTQQRARSLCQQQGPVGIDGKQLLKGPWRLHLERRRFSGCRPLWMQQALRCWITSRTRSAASSSAQSEPLQAGVSSSGRAPQLRNAICAVVVRAWAPTLTAGGPEKRQGRGPAPSFRPSRADRMPHAARTTTGRRPAKCRRPWARSALGSGLRP